MDKSQLLSDLLDVEIFKLGEFMLKSKHSSPFYVDLRHLPSHPRLLNAVVAGMHELILREALGAVAVCGVPYNALPFAAVLSSRHNIPLLLKRKEAKAYGTKKLIEGVIVPGTSCLLIEDVVVSGASIKETADALRAEGLVVSDCVVILDRLQGGKENLAKFGIRMHSLFDIEDILSLRCNQEVTEKVRCYLRNNKQKLEVEGVVRRPFADRAKDCGHPILKRLFETIERKKSNLCVAVDVEQSSKLLEIASKVAPHICMLKTHSDLLDDFSSDVSSKLSALATKHNFLILEDSKFGDIGNIVRRQFEGGAHRISEWADVVTVHGLPGSGVLESLKKASDGKERACLLVAQMSSRGNLTDSHYTQQVVQMAESHPDFVMGFICLEGLSSYGNFIHVCPGVNIAADEDTFGQQYRTPEEAIASGADVVTVGRGICSASDVTKTAIEYKNRAYAAYLKNCEI